MPLCVRFWCSFNMSVSTSESSSSRNRCRAQVLCVILWYLIHRHPLSEYVDLDLGWKKCELSVLQCINTHFISIFISKLLSVWQNIRNLGYKKSCLFLIEMEAVRGLSELLILIRLKFFLPLRWLWIVSVTFDLRACTISLLQNLCLYTHCF